MDKEHVAKTVQAPMQLPRIAGEPDWLTYYREKNLAVMKTKRVEKSSFFDVLHFDSLINSAMKEGKGFAVVAKGARVLGWKDALSDKKISASLKFVLENEQEARNQFEAFVNANFVDGKIIILEEKGAELSVQAPEFVPVKNIILAKQGEEQSVLQKVDCLNGAGNAMLNTTLLLPAESKLTMLVIPKAQGLINSQGLIMRGAHLRQSTAWLYGQATKASQLCAMLGDSSQAEQNDLIFLSGAQQTHTDFVALHAGRATQSKTTLKCALRGSARQSFDGMIKILRSAQQSDAYLEANSMLLSGEARSVSVPKLEIEADDVKATHSATVEHLEEEKMFYLRSRAMTQKEAEEIIIASFLEKSLADYPKRFSDGIRELVLEKLALN